MEALHAVLALAHRRFGLFTVDFALVLRLSVGFRGQGMRGGEHGGMTVASMRDINDNTLVTIILAIGI